ncbi:hypothetical protein SAMN05660772_02084 [Pasteurella testudinis DSM 23072]|uniref:Uncharacterized protein n=1 Tax=Pasteurella testudinis DSM 23072 TaxID=1122938 RepID=A0A1W1UMQ1_9PAST|nr:hypothetical protein [Pasteurella testudinis]SMB82376.1 hypothetical protein SAMN05660772_02084 [Pasteurella testudinis DSM 23072]SUB52230.1 Uncharacterised protein [Pasteurella testudinis]
MEKEVETPAVQIGVVHTGNKLEVHQHFLRPVDRQKLIRDLMSFKDSDPTFFKLVQNICTELHGNFMFSKLPDGELKALHEVKNLVFGLYQEKEQHRLEVISLSQQLQRSPVQRFIRKLLVD